MSKYLSKSVVQEITDVCYNRLQRELSDNRGLSDEALKKEFCIIDIKLPRQIGKTQSVCDFLSDNNTYHCAVICSREHTLQTHIDRVNDNNLVQFHKFVDGVMGNVDIIFDVSNSVSIDDISTSTLLFKIQ